MPPTEGLTIRVADTDEDVERIFLLLYREYEEFGRAPLDPVKAFYEIARCVAFGAAFIVEQDGAPVASLGLVEIEWFFSQDTFLDALWLYALPSHRDGKAFELLLAEAKALAEEAGKIVYVTVRGTRRRKSGIQVAGERLAFVPAGLVLEVGDG